MGCGLNHILEAEYPDTGGRFGRWCQNPVVKENYCSYPK